MKNSWIESRDWKNKEIEYSPPEFSQAEETKVPTCNNPNNERIANYGCYDDGGEGECPE